MIRSSSRRTTASAVARASTSRVAWVVALAVTTVLAATQAAAQSRPQVDLACESFGRGPQLDCTVRAMRDGAPLDGAQVTLGATMPSMPAAHSVRPVPAAPTGRPGEYRGTMTLEMLGVWAVQVDVAGPVRDRAVRNLLIEGCDGDRRCPAATARADAPRAGSGAHKH